MLKKIVIALAFMAGFAAVAKANTGYTYVPDLSGDYVQVDLDVWDSTVSVPTTGTKQGAIRVPFAMTVNRWELVGDASGSAKVDVLESDDWSTLASAASIVSSSTPTATSVQVSSGSTSGWATTSLPQGAYLKANLVSVATMKRVKLYLIGTRN